MKNYVLSIAIYFIILNNLLAEIKNGYETQIQTARESYRNLTALLLADQGLSLLQKEQIKIKIENIAAFISYYELTTKLLAEFRNISPAMYDEINFIKDYEGRPVDVYVKFVPGNQLPEPLKATTNVDQAVNDKNAYYSEYGSNTVSVKIAIVKKSLRLLAHEFGHIRYLVPNLANYIKYFLNYYKNILTNANHIGHHPNDPSGRMAQEYERRFRNHYATLLKRDNHAVENNERSNTASHLDSTSMFKSEYPLWFNIEQRKGIEL